MGDFFFLKSHIIQIFYPNTDIFLYQFLMPISADIINLPEYQLQEKNIKKSHSIY